MPSIQYSDPKYSSPDTTLLSQELDLDYDDRPDVIIEEWYQGVSTMEVGAKVSYSHSFIIKPLNKNAIHKHPIPKEKGIYKYMDWTAIYVTLSRKHISDNYEGDWNGDWVGVRERYLGVQLWKNGRNHYGWIHLSCSEETGEVAIYDWEVSSSPGVIVVAGSK